MVDVLQCAASSGIALAGPDLACLAIFQLPLTLDNCFVREPSQVLIIAWGGEATLAISASVLSSTMPTSAPVASLVLATKSSNESNKGSDLAIEAIAQNAVSYIRGTARRQRITCMSRASRALEFGEGHRVCDLCN